MRLRCVSHDDRSENATEYYICGERKNFLIHVTLFQRFFFQLLSKKVCFFSLLVKHNINFVTSDKSSQPANISQEDGHILGDISKLKHTAYQI